MIAAISTLARISQCHSGGMAAAAEPDPEAVQAWFEGLYERPLLLIGGGLLLLLPVAWIQGFCQLLGTAPFARAVLDLAPVVAPETANSADMNPIGH